MIFLVNIFGSSIALKKIVIAVFVCVQGIFYLCFGQQVHFTESNNLPESNYNNAQSFLQQAKYDSAIYYFEESIKLNHERKDWGNYVKSLNSLTDVYIEIDKVSIAEKYNKIALDSGKVYLGEQNIEVSCSINNKGIITAKKGYNELAISYFEKALAGYTNSGIGINHYVALALQNIGEGHATNWEFTKALEFNLEALSIDMKVFPPDNYVIAKDYIILANNYTLLYNPIALTYLRKAQKIITDKYGENHPYIGEICIERANYYFYEREIDSVFFYSEKAKNNLLNFYSENHFWFYLIHQRLAYTCRFCGLMDKAYTHQKKAIEILETRDINDIINMAWAYNWMYKIGIPINFPDQKSRQAHFDFGFKYINKGIRVLIPDYLDTSRYSNPSLNNVISDKSLLNLLRNKADIFASYYHFTNDIADLKASLSTLVLLDKLTDKIILGRDMKESKKNLWNEVFAYLNMATTSAYELYIQTGNADFLDSVFYFSEKNKAKMLCSLTNESEAIKFANLPDSILRNYSEAKQQLINFEELIFQNKYNTSKDSNYESEMLDSLFEYRTKYSHLTTELETKYPEYYNLKYNNKIVSTADLQEILDDSTAVLGYSVKPFSNNYSPGMIIGYIITSDTCRFFRTLKDNKFEEHYESFRQFLISPDLKHSGKEDFRSFTKAGNFLYNKLVAPCEDLLPVKSLIVIPDGILCHIPFEALLSEVTPEQGSNFKSLSYLVKEYSVSYANSATLFYKDMQSDYIRDKYINLIAFAPSDKNDSGRCYRGGQNNGLQALKGSFEEVKSIHSIIDGTVYTGSNASETNFKRNAGEYSIIHIATHGVVDKEHPLNSRLVFSCSDDLREDGALHIYELYDMQLNARMAVLSACNTGFGELEKGEGILSLARGFAYAGVPSVVMSLWKIKDKSTALLMEKFYTNLRKGYTKDKALQQAKLDFLHQSDNYFAHPHFWAGFVHIGDRRELVVKKPFSYWWGLALVFILAVGVLVIRNRFTRKT
jgi:CHAT domain-containing protein